MDFPKIPKQVVVPKERKVIRTNIPQATGGSNIMKYFDGHSSTGNVLPNSATLITSAEETVISKDGNSEETVDEEVVKMTDIEPNVAVSTELQ